MKKNYYSKKEGKYYITAKGYLYLIGFAMTLPLRNKKTGELFWK